MFFYSLSLRLLNALNSEDRGLKVRFSLAMIVFETFELILCQMLSSQGKNAPSNPYPHYLVRLATSRVVSVLRHSDSLLKIKQKSLQNVVIHYIFSSESLRVVNSLQILGSGFGRTDFSRIFFFGAAGFFR